MARSRRRPSRAAPRRGHAASPRGAGLTAMFEALEARLPMAADIGTALWRITGDQVKGNFDDTIVVDRDPANAALLRNITIQAAAPPLGYPVLETAPLSVYAL